MITFVMLTWNRREFVKRCLDSFFKNISHKIEYSFIILDNGSTDGTKEYLKEFSQLNKHIKCYYNKKNLGLKSYKKVLNKAKGDYIVIVDDDVIEFPNLFDQVMIDYMFHFQDFGFLALDVIQNQHTNGAKPSEEHYCLIKRDNFSVLEGPAGGWCSILRKKDYDKIKFSFNFKKLDMKHGEDGTLISLLSTKLQLKCGIIYGVKCFHACGPYYSKEFGYLERDITKYQQADLDSFVTFYKNFSTGDKL